MATMSLQYSQFPKSQVDIDKKPELSDFMIIFRLPQSEGRPYAQ